MQQGVETRTALVSNHQIRPARSITIQCHDCADNTEGTQNNRIKRSIFAGVLINDSELFFRLQHADFKFTLEKYVGV